VTIEAFVAGFAAKLRERAVFLRGHGAAEAAATCEQMADEFDRDFRAWWLTELTIGQATAESGYSADRLRDLVREGRLPDLRPPGTSGEIRIRRADLPRRPGRALAADAVETLAAQVLAGRK